MNKVVYSVMKAGRKDSKITGLGYVSNDDLIIACLSKDSKPYIRIFEDCVKRCHLVVNTTNEFKGAYDEIKAIEIEVKDSQGNPTVSYETREVEISYNIWYKILD